MIEISQLAKSFVKRSTDWIGLSRHNRVEAVKDISLSAADGAITALLGPNGAGKTTTLRVLATLVKADHGSVKVGGRDVLTDAEAVRADIGVLSDARGLYVRLTARENIRYYGALRGMNEHAIEVRIATLAEWLELDAILDRRTEGFSTGERLKVALARALVHDPKHLILDEPTNGLDVMASRALRRMLLRLREAGQCIVFSSHVMQEVEALCDHVVIVADGRTVASGSIETICDRTQTRGLEDAFIALAFPSMAARAVQ